MTVQVLRCRRVRALTVPNAARTGRPTVLTGPLVAEICTLLRAGVSISDACYYVGIHRSTYYGWCAGRSRYQRPDARREFSDMVRKARAEAVIRNVIVVDKAAGADPDMALRWLTFRWRREFGTA